MPDPRMHRNVHDRCSDQDERWGIRMSVYIPDEELEEFTTSLVGIDAADVDDIRSGQAKNLSCPSSVRAVGNVRPDPHDHAGYVCVAGNPLDQRPFLVR